LTATGSLKWTAVILALVLVGWASIHRWRGTNGGKTREKTGDKTGEKTGEKIGEKAGGQTDGGPRPRGRESAQGSPPATARSDGAGGFINLAVAPGEPLGRAQGTPINPPPPSGWLWYEIAGAICRDKSPTGFYVRFTASDRLLIFLEGGGACINPGFCRYNPASVDQILSGGGQTGVGSLWGAVAGRQQPGCYSDGSPSGIFDSSNDANPFKNWNMVYVPYCTGDVFFGTRTDVMIPGVTAPQQFVGYRNMQKFVARLVPTFKDTIKRVVLSGSSAGGFGAVLNFSMVKDSFGDGIAMDLVDDSGPSFSDRSMPVCMQKRWRDLWGFSDAFPPDCAECFQADGGGLLQITNFLQRKHPSVRAALISSMQDEIIRLFYSAGNSDCDAFDDAHPVRNLLFTLGATFPAEQYTAGLNDLRATYTATHHFATYYLGGASITSHQRLWRPSFFDAAAGVSTARWLTDFLDGRMTHIGP
jgi:Pectinacetylesterase